MVDVHFLVVSTDLSIGINESLISNNLNMNFEIFLIEITAIW